MRIQKYYDTADNTHREKKNHKKPKVSGPKAIFFPSENKDHMVCVCRNTAKTDQKQIPLALVFQQREPPDTPESKFQFGEHVTRCGLLSDALEMSLHWLPTTL